MTVGTEYRPSTSQGVGRDAVGGHEVVDSSEAHLLLLDVLLLDVLETVLFFDTTAALTRERKRNTVNMVKMAVSTSTESKM